jgi:hypothetical protein
MKDFYEIVKNYSQQLQMELCHENKQEGILVVKNEPEGIVDLIICVAPPMIVFEQFIFEIGQPSAAVYKALLQKNRDMIHGAFTLDDSGCKVIYRNTLQVENLDLNEFEGTINALGLLLGEYSEQIIKFSIK